MAFYSPAGREWLRVGRPARQPEWSFELNRARTARLLWERELLLDARLPVRSEGGVVGAVIVEQPVRVLTALYGTVSEFGETGEVGVCAVRDAAIQCLPQRRTPRAVNAEYAGLPPMTQALAGRTGTMRTRDYRGRQVIAAFGPVGDLGLGMIEKMDTVELYAPLRTAFHGALLLLCALTGGGAALLYWRLKPLVGALERSRERVRAEGEQALQTSEERYRYLFEVSPMPMWVRDLDRHRLLAVNDAAVQMYGYTREEFLSMTTLDLRAPDDIAAYRSRIGAWDETAESLHGVDRHRRKDGTEMRVEATSRLIEFDGRPARLVLLSDVTERLRSEEQVRQLNAELEQRVAERTRLLEAANQELEGFSYSVSHDLRAPLRAVIGFSRLLVEDHAQQLDEEARRKLEVIRSEAQRMGELIDDLLAFSRLGRKAMQMSDLDMTELARTAFQGLNGQQAGARADFRLAELPRARGDRVLLGQVWANLLSNALKFSSKRDRPVIEVGATTDERGHVYFVRDNGAGFDPRYQSKLFGVFERLHSTDEFPGTGVGLALVARIVLRHGGRVWAEGKPGEGATFYFTLPREPHNEPV